MNKEDNFGIRRDWRVFMSFQNPLYWIDEVKKKTIKYTDRSTYQHARYIINRDSVLAESIERKKRTLEKLNMIRSERGCARCGNMDFRVLVFHHLDQKTKNFDVCRCLTYGWKRILEEIEKCQVLCQNCHIIVEWEKRIEQQRGTQWLLEQDRKNVQLAVIASRLDHKKIEEWE